MAEAREAGHGEDDAVPSGSARAAFVRGLREFPVVPGVILLSAVMGFGALARDLGVDLGVAVFSTAAIFALPAQVTLLTEQAHGASLLASAIAVMLTSTRLLPMAVVLSPYLRGSSLPRWALIPGHPLLRRDTVGHRHAALARDRSARPAALLSGLRRSAIHAGDGGDRAGVLHCRRGAGAHRRRALLPDANLLPAVDAAVGGEIDDRQARDPAGFALGPAARLSDAGIRSAHRRTSLAAARPMSLGRRWQAS